MSESGIYETSDIDSEPESTVVPPSHPDIIEEEFDINKSFKRFNHQYINGEINFDYTINHSLSDSGFKVSVEESRQEKLNRIAKELMELSVQDESTGHHDDELERLINLAEDLKGKRPDINGYNHRIRQLFDNFEHQQEVINSGAPPTTSINDNHLINLDKKLNSLEQRLGNVHGPIDNIINELSRKVEIVHNPEYKMAELNESITKILEKHESIHHLNDINDIDLSSFNNDKVHELLNYLPLLEQYHHTSELLINRLKLLHRSHLNIDNAVQFVDTLHHSLAHLDDELNQWDASLQRINEKLDANQDLFNDNKHQIQGWITELKSMMP